MNTVFLCIRTVYKSDTGGISEIGLFGIATDEDELNKLIDAFLTVHDTSREDAFTSSKAGWEIIGTGNQSIQWCEVECNNVTQAFQLVVSKAET